MIQSPNAGRLLLNDLDDEPMIGESTVLPHPVPTETSSKFKLTNPADVFGNVKLLKISLMLAVAIILLLSIVIIALATDSKTSNVRSLDKVCQKLLIRNGFVKYSFNSLSDSGDYIPGTIANLTCHHHSSTMLGSHSRFCTNNGTWSGTETICLTLVYLIGGYSGTVDHDQVAVFYPEQPELSYNLTSRLKTARDGHVAFKNTDGQIYVIGGHGTSALTETEKLNPQLLKWTSGVPLPSPVATAVGGLIGNQYYVCGGYATPFVARNDCYVYSIPEQTWDVSEPMNSPRKYSCSFVLKNKFYVIGGVNGDGFLLNSVEVFDPSMRQWSYAHSYPSAVQDCGATVLGTNGYVCGGRNMTKQLKQCYVYDPLRDEWIPFVDMNESREDFQLIAINDRIYAILGEIYGAWKFGILSDTIEWIRPLTDKRWTAIPKMGDLLGRRELFAVA